MTMHALSARELVAVWEAGERQHPVDRALLLLAAALPHRTHDELAALPVGRRDVLLLRAREATLGSRLECAAPCPRCRTRLEFGAEVGELVKDAPPEDAPRVHVARGGGVQMRFRLLDSRDLALSARMADAEQARRALLRACLLAVRPLPAPGGPAPEGSGSGSDGPASDAPASEGPVPGGSGPDGPADDGGGWSEPPEEPGDEMLAALGEALVQADPMMDLQFSIRCKVCGEQWTSLLEPVAFVWTEVAAAAARLLREVDRLARAYGWSEGEILELSAARRGAYLELVP